MNFQKANLINAIVLVTTSVWMYRSSVNPSIGHLLPLLIGVIVLALNNGIKAGSQEQKSVAFLTNILMVISMIYMLTFNNSWNEEGFKLFIILFLVINLVSFFLYIKESRNSKP